MNDKKVGTIAKVVSIILILLLLIAVVGVIFKFTNGFTDDFKTFYVEYDGKVLATTDKVTLVKGETATFNVKYTFDSDEAEARDYTVKIVSSADSKTAFNYKVEGTRYSFTNNLDLTQAFEIEQGERGFTLTAPSKMQDVLKIYHGGKDAELDEPDMSANVYFKIIVTPYNGKSPITLSLYLREPPVGSVEVDKDAIVFEGVAKYSIGYKVIPVRGSGLDYSGMVDFKCESSAEAGAMVTFSYSTGSSIFEPIALYGMKSGFIKYLTDVEPESSGTLSFEMPSEDVYVEFAGLY